MRSHQQVCYDLPALTVLRCLHHRVDLFRSQLVRYFWLDSIWFLTIVPMPMMLMVMTFMTIESRIAAISGTSHGLGPADRRFRW